MNRLYRALIQPLPSVPQKYVSAIFKEHLVRNLFKGQIFKIPESKFPYKYLILCQNRGSSSKNQNSDIVL